MNSNQYCQRVDLTREEQTELYMKLPKEKLVAMLVECNRVIDTLSNINNQCYNIENNN